MERPLLAVFVRDAYVVAEPPDDAHLSRGEPSLGGEDASGPTLASEAVGRSRSGLGRRPPQPGVAHSCRRHRARPSPPNSTRRSTFAPGGSPRQRPGSPARRGSLTLASSCRPFRKAARAEQASFYGCEGSEELRWPAAVRHTPRRPRCRDQLRNNQAWIGTGTLGGPPVSTTLNSGPITSKE